MEEFSLMELSHFQNRKGGTDYMTPRHFPESLSSCILSVTVYATTVLNKDAVAPVIIVYYNRGLRQLHISRKKGHCFKNDHSRGRSVAEFVFSRQRIDSNLLRNFWKNQLDWVRTEIGSINPGTRSALRGSAITRVYLSAMKVWRNYLQKSEHKSGAVCTASNLHKQLPGQALNPI